MMMMMGGRNNNSRFPFTASQWQELEHQALIFKYMASGYPIPSDLILSMRRSIMLESSPLYAHHPNMGWGCYQMGFGRKAEDPEPGRCRRTDGKKWRCSKEAHPDSKYCERHMHRGKNRSRKPVETNLSTTSTNTITPTSTNVGITTNTNQTNSSSLYPTPNHLLSDAHNSYFNMDSAASSNRDYRYYHGMREEVNQFSGFQGGATAQDGSWRFTPLGMSSLGEPKQRSFCYEGGGGEEKQNHCFVLGADFKVQRSVEREEAEKPLRRFFDEWPLKSKEESWIDVEHDRSGWSSSVSKTQLSISTPMAHHDFSISQSHTDD